ncbi:MAG: flagellar hook-length control protein FliK [Alistipes sp.]|nr:flagellar hook-length control protein FliK [Alistipes sp.]
MVSSGISNNVNPVRPVEAPKGNGTKNPEMDFGVIMSQQSLSAGTDSAKNQSVGQNVQATKTLMNTASGQTENRVKNVSENKTESAVKSDKQPKGQPEQVSEVSDKVKDVTDDIREKIKDEFDVTDEDIEKALEALGMVMMDLLDEGNLTDFVVELTGMENAVDLLVSPEISAQLSDLSDFIGETLENLSEELDIPADELENLLKDAAVLDDVSKETSEIPVEATEEKVPVTTEKAAVILPKETAQRPEDTDKTVKDIETESVVPEGKEIVLKEEKAPQDKQTSQNSQSGLTRQESPEPQINPVINNFTDAVNEVFEARFDERINPVQIIEQIVEAAKVTLNQEVTTMELMLNPESLGKINMTVSVREGIVTATLAAQNDTAREAIESQILVLKENLNNQGIKVEAVEVTVESHAFDANANQNPNNGFDEQREQAQKKNNRPLRLDSLEDLDMEDLTEEERIVMDMMASEGNQINFTA